MLLASSYAAWEVATDVACEVNVRRDVDASFKAVALDVSPGVDLLLVPVVDLNVVQERSLGSVQTL